MPPPSTPILTFGPHPPAQREGQGATLSATERKTTSNIIGL
jgi:hypothetical protein